MDSKNLVNHHHHLTLNLPKSLGRQLFWVVASLTVIFLAGCISASRTQTHFDVNHFTAQGKIALRYPKCPQYRACEEEGVSTSMDWFHSNSEDSLTFYDPLGQAQASLTYDNGKVTIHEDGETRSTDAASLEQELGMPMPIDALRELVFNQQSQESFTYKGWQVRVNDWQGQFYRSVRLRQDSYYLRLIIYNIQ